MRGVSLRVHIMIGTYEGLYFCTVSYQRRGRPFNFTRSINLSAVCETPILHIYCIYTVCIYTTCVQRWEVLEYKYFVTVLKYMFLVSVLYSTTYLFILHVYIYTTVHVYIYTTLHVCIYTTCVYLSHRP